MIKFSFNERYFNRYHLKGIKIHKLVELSVISRILYLKVRISRDTFLMICTIVVQMRKFLSYLPPGH